MTQFKCIATVTWKFDHDKGIGEALDFARTQLEQILDTNPQGDEFSGYSIQVDIARMRDRKKMIHLGMFTPNEVLPFIGDQRKEFRVGDRVYLVKMDSSRYHLFKKSRQCVICGLEGNRMILEMNQNDSAPHFNLYAEENGRLVLMTKDHIVPKSKGGSEDLENFRVMCHTCNNLRGNYDLTLDQIRYLRTIYNNEAKLPRKELREILNEAREQLQAQNQEQNDNERGNPPESSGSCDTICAESAAG